MIASESRSSTEDLRALARGYRAMYEQALGALLRIRDESTSRDEMLAAATEALDELGEGLDD